MHVFMFAPALYRDTLAQFSQLEETEDYQVSYFGCRSLAIFSYCTLMYGKNAKEYESINITLGSSSAHYLIFTSVNGTDAKLLKAVDGDSITSDIAQDHFPGRAAIFTVVFLILALLLLRTIRSMTRT